MTSIFERKSPIAERNVSFQGRLYRAPAPIPGEVASSWVFRLAERYDLSPKIMRRALQLRTIHFDVHRRWVNVDHIAFATVKDAVAVEATFRLADRDLGYRANWPLVCRLDRSPLYRYCPKCFAEDEIPYIRLAWRVAFTVFCERHRIALSDRCPQCDSNFSIDLRTRQRRLNPRRLDHSMRYCHSCGTLLAEQEPLAVPPVLIPVIERFQTTSLRAIQFGYHQDRYGGRISAEYYLRSFLKSVPVWRGDGLEMHVHTVDWPRIIGVPHYKLFKTWLKYLDIDFPEVIRLSPKRRPKEKRKKHSRYSPEFNLWMVYAFSDLEEFLPRPVIVRQRGVLEPTE